MDRSESNLSPADDVACDAALQRIVTGLSFPPTSPTIALHVLSRVRQRRRRRQVAIGTLAAAAVLTIGAFFRYWNAPVAPEPLAKSQQGPAGRHEAPRPGPNDVADSKTNRSGLDDKTLSELFALPPVDALGLLRKRLDVAVHVLDQAEANR